MKKIILSALAVAAITVSASAASKVTDMSTVTLGYGSASSTELFASSEAAYGISYDFVGHAFEFLPEGVGVGLGLNVYGIGGTTTVAALTSAGGELKVGYTLGAKFDIPVFVRAGVGYGYTYNSADGAGGLQWSVDANWKIWKHLGVGVKYQSNSIDYTGVNSTTIDTTMGYVSYVF